MCFNSVIVRATTKSLRLRLPNNLRTCLVLKISKMKVGRETLRDQARTRITSRFPEVDDTILSNTTIIIIIVKQSVPVLLLV